MGRIALADLEISGARIPAEGQGEVEFTVADQGNGISVEEQSGLFAKFHRREGAQKSTVKGSGLGLASCRILADLMVRTIEKLAMPWRRQMAVR